MSGRPKTSRRARRDIEQELAFTVALVELLRPFTDAAAWRDLKLRDDTLDRLEALQRHARRAGLWYLAAEIGDELEFVCTGVRT